MTMTWSTTVSRMVWRASSDPLITWAVQVGNGTGGGTSMPSGTAGQVPQIATGGTTYELKTPNTASGLVRLDGSALIPDNLIPSSIARDTEVTAAVTSHNSNADAHDGTFDRAGMALAVSHLAGLQISSWDDFGLQPDGTIHGKTTHGSGAADPLTWNDARTAVGESLDGFLEVAQVDNGVLRHRGTRLVASAAVVFPDAGAFGHAVVLGYAPETPGPGGGYPGIGVTESEYASARVSFVDGAASNGYVGYVQQASDIANHTMQIVRDDSSIPTTIGGPWDLGRRLEAGDVVVFMHEGNRFTMLLNGSIVGTVVEETYSYTTFDASSIVLNTESLWLPGVTTWALGTLGQSIVGIDGTGNLTTAVKDVQTLADEVDALTLGGGSTVDVVSNVAQDHILGRTSSGSGDSEELTAAQVRTLLGNYVVGGQGLGTALTDGASMTSARSLLTSTVTTPAIVAGDVLEFVAAVNLLNNSGAARNYTFTLKYGSTNLVALTITSLTQSATTYPIVVSGHIRANGNNDVSASLQVTGGTGTQTLMRALHGSSTAEANQTGGLALDLLLTGNATAATQSVQLQSLYVKKVAA